MAPRIAFMRPYSATAQSQNLHRFFSPATVWPGRSIDALRAQHKLSGQNIGNFIHTEAMSRILDYDIDLSGSFSPNHLAASFGIKRVCEILNENFDMVVFSCANLIRPETKFGLEMSMFRGLKIPAVIVGAGLQNALPDGRAALDRHLVDFLDFASSEALLFGVRGDITANWLHDNGFAGAQSLGCPSFYAFPEKIMSITAPDLSGPVRLGTAGHIASRNGPGKRYRTLMELVSCVPNITQISYALQNEPFFNPEDMDHENALDRATHQLDPDWVSRKFFRVPFDETIRPDFRFFTDTAAWRQHSDSLDMYLGDRIHGGVICMQAGKPAIFVYNDDRVRELADKLGAPSIALSQAADIRTEEFVENFLSEDRMQQMQNTYRGNAKTFLDTLKQRGLTLSQTHSGIQAALAET